MQSTFLSGDWLQSSARVIRVHLPGNYNPTVSFHKPALYQGGHILFCGRIFRNNAATISKTFKATHCDCKSLKWLMVTECLALWPIL